MFPCRSLCFALKPFTVHNYQNHGSQSPVGCVNGSMKGILGALEVSVQKSRGGKKSRLKEPVSVGLSRSDPKNWTSTSSFKRVGSD